jgi:cytochrome P450
MPGGASIVLSTINMHRSPEWWGNDADEFNPSRWKERKEIPLAYRPFNAGPRTVRLIQVTN